MEDVVFLNGDFIPDKDAVISVRTHALQYGTGCFEGIRAYYSGKDKCLFAFRLEDHFIRLQNSAKILYMDLKYTVSDLKNIVIKLLQDNFTEQDLYVRPFLYKSDTVVGNFSLDKLTTGICIYTTPHGRVMNTESGIRASVSSWERVTDNSIPPRAKVNGAYVNTCLAKTEAIIAGYNEAIFLDRNGHVLEGSSENLLLIKNGQISTPPSSDDILIGITRDTIIKILKDEFNINVIERSIGRTELYQADEVLLVGTGAEISPVIEIDGRKIGAGNPGNIFTELKKLYYAITHGQNMKYQPWVTKVLKI